MTYFNFLAIFVCIPGLILLGITWWDDRRGRDAAAFYRPLFWSILFVHVALAVVYTTPWDNYLVATGVWYYNPKLVTGVVLGWVPVEEYTFFILETILSGLWWLFLARRLPPPVKQFEPSLILRLVSFAVICIAWVFFTALWFGGWKPGTYLSLILLWALPAIFPQVLFGADILWYYRRQVFWTIFLPGLYLSLTDIIALNATTWLISPGQTTGIRFFSVLPVEEVVFFFMTNVLIGFGMTLMLSKLSRARFASWKQRRFRGMP